MFKKLLVPLDRSPLAEQALGPAGDIARAARASIDVMLAHPVLPFGGFNDAPWYAERVIDEKRYTRGTAAALMSGGSIRATHAVMRGEPVEMICQRAKDIEADLIVMTSHGRTGLGQAWMGSVADGVVRHARTPVLMLRPRDAGTEPIAASQLFRHILVPLDGSSLAMDILPSASALARCCRSKVSLLRVVRPVLLDTLDMGVPFVSAAAIQDDVATQRVVDEAKDELSDAGRSLVRAGLTEVRTHVVVASHVATAIIEYASTHTVNAIAMSTHGRGASRWLIGSIADQVLRASKLPMLLQRPIVPIAEPNFWLTEEIMEELPAFAGR